MKTVTQIQKQIENQLTKIKETYNTFLVNNCSFSDTYLTALHDEKLIVILINNINLNVKS